MSWVNLVELKLNMCMHVRNYLEIACLSTNMYNPCEMLKETHVLTTSSPNELRMVSISHMHVQIMGE